MELSKTVLHFINLKALICTAILFILVDIISSTFIAKAPAVVPPACTVSSSPHQLKFVSSRNTSFSTTDMKNNKMEPTLIRNLKNTSSIRKRSFCDIFQGRWVVDDGQTRPSYPPGECTFVNSNFNCLRSGRLNLNYTMLRWKPDDCDLPRMTGRKMARFLRGKRLAFVGDSLGRNMFESLLCMLTNFGIGEKKVLAIRKTKLFETFHFESANFPDYNFTVDSIEAQFLVRKLNKTLRLDLMPEVSEHYKNADIIVFNSGHWWRHRVTNHGNNFYQEGEHVHDHLAPKAAFRRALETWSKWMDANIDSTRTQVFFRSISPVHYSGGLWNSGGSCRGENFPIKELRNVTKFDLQDTLETALRNMTTPVRYLNITTMSSFRKDAHPSIFRGKEINETIQDCGHWCLPGVPDTWNELLFTILMSADRNSFLL